MLWTALPFFLLLEKTTLLFHNYTGIENLPIKELLLFTKLLLHILYSCVRPFVNGVLYSVSIQSQNLIIIFFFSSLYCFSVMSFVYGVHCIRFRGYLSPSCVGHRLIVSNIIIIQVL